MIKRTAEGREKAEKVYQESLQVLDRVDRENNHDAREQDDLVGVFEKSTAERNGVCSAHGVDFVGPKSSVDAPWVWPRSKIALRRWIEEGRLHRCEACDEAKPYTEFDRVECSMEYNGRRCNACVESKRRRRDGSRHISGNDSVGAARSRATA